MRKPFSITMFYFILFANYCKSSDITKFFSLAQKGENIKQFRLIDVLKNFLVNNTFHIIIYRDNMTAVQCDKIIREINSNNNFLTTFTLNNFEARFATQNVKRPQVPNVLNMILSSNINYWKYISVPGVMNYRDILLFIAQNEDIKLQIIEEYPVLIKLAGRTLLFERKDNVESIYKICFYCGEDSKVFLKIGVNDLINQTEHFKPMTFRNLNNHELNIVFIANHPYAYCQSNENVLWKNKTIPICRNITGIESKMFHLISRKMNFTYIAFQQPDNASYYTMLNNMADQGMHIAIGAISITQNRRQKIQFTKQYHAEEFNLLYKTTTTLREMCETFFDPFQSPLVWILMSVALIAIGVLLYFSQKLKNGVYQTLTVKHCLWLLFQVQLEQSVSGGRVNIAYKKPITWLFLVALWCFTCLVLCAAYKGATLSSIMHPPRREPQNFEQLVNADYQIIANNQSKDLVAEILNVNRPLYRQVMRDIQYGESTCSIFDKVQHKRVAMLEELSTLEYDIKRTCSPPNPKIESQLRVTRYSVRQTGHAWAIRAGTPFKPALDYYLGVLSSGGLFGKLKRDFTFAWPGGKWRRFRRSREAIQDKVEETALQLNKIYPLFLLLFCGLTCSTLSFVIEILYHTYLSVKQKLNKRLK